MPLAKSAIPERLRDEARRIIRAADEYERATDIDERRAISDISELAMPRLATALNRMIALRKNAGKAVSRPR